MSFLVKKIDNLMVINELIHQLEPFSDLSYFQSWGWYEAGTNLFDGNWFFLVATTGHNVVGIAPFFINHIKRRGIISSKALYLNESGNRHDDMFAEYNGFIAKRGLEVEVADAFLEYLMSSDISFDEIIINRILSDNPLLISKVIKDKKLKLCITEDWISRYVDLKKLKDSNQDYITTLSKNSRAQLRRSLRKYEELGKVTLYCADNVDKALQYFSNLGELHQKYWIAKGVAGIFAKKNWVNFHQSIITKRFEFSEVQLLKIKVGDDVIGYIYSLVHNRHVYMIQTGFNYLPDKAFRPGYVCHYLAIEYNKDQGADIYNFLVGDGQYKKSLSNDFDILYSVALQKNKLKFKIENSILSFKRRIAGYLSPLG